MQQKFKIPLLNPDEIFFIIREKEGYYISNYGRILSTVMNYEKILTSRSGICRVFGTNKIEEIAKKYRITLNK